MNRLFEIERWCRDADLVIGVDEAGRGCLAGPVVVAAVALDVSLEPIRGEPVIRDSKKLSRKTRKKSFESIVTSGEIHAIEFVSHDEIDATNILQATLSGMRNAVIQCLRQFELPDDVVVVVLVDGNREIPNLPAYVIQQTVVEGDNLCYSIAAASILAKESRDLFVENVISVECPEYSFEKHKGYGTALHMDAIATHGPCKYHRLSFKPFSTATD